MGYIFILRELRDKFLKHNTTSIHCYDDTKLNQHSKNGGSGGLKDIIFIQHY